MKDLFLEQSLEIAQIVRSLKLLMKKKQKVNR